ncbi:MAG TPA: ATP-binding protein, partial [Gemmatimonadaceae bacterium]|nr:ATP-binding protein [Gemmatimonadaceae bacterium]
AHNGVLFLDEMLEFPRFVLDGLRQPMEDGRVIISRVSGSVRFPARFTLVGATNPCPCGRLGDPTGVCKCSASDVERYSSRMSGPLADRIDMHVGVGAVPLTELGQPRRGETSSDIRNRVVAARESQRVRFHNLPGVSCNAHASGRCIDSRSVMAADARNLLHGAASSLALSARGYHRVMKVARTIADLDQSASVERPHVAEALRYRPFRNA